MKLCFINTCLRPGTARRLVPVGLAYVLTATARAGFDFDLIDMDIHPMTMEELEQELVRGQYDTVGLGCIVTGFRQVREITSLIRQVSPQALIFAGNSVATSIPELLLRNTEVDVAVIGEGDITVVELLRAAEAGSDMGKVAGIAFLKDGAFQCTPPRSLIPDLDTIPHPDWTLFDLKEYDKYAHINSNSFGDHGPVKAFPVNTARGCPFNCTFCYHVFKGQKYRRYSDARITQEFIRLRSMMGIDFATLWDELSFPTTKSIESFLEALSHLDFSIGWEAACRAGLIRREHLPLAREMKELGCDSLAFSLENACEDILLAMDKRTSVAQFIEQAETLHQAGIVPTTSVIFGFPQETPESIAKTFEVCRQSGIYPSVGFLLPLPGTPVYQAAVAKGVIPDEVEYLARIGDRQDFHINLTRMSDAEFVGTVTSELEKLAAEMGIKVGSVFKTTTYQRPARNGGPKN